MAADRIVPIHSEDNYLLDIKWQENYFIDFALPFGLYSGPAIFPSIVDLLEWSFLHYLDDFHTVGLILLFSKELWILAFASLQSGAFHSTQISFKDPPSVCLSSVLNWTR